MMKLKYEGQAVDPAALDAEVKSAVAEIVRKQAEIGLDVISDGEMSKVGFIPYVNERLTGFEPGSGTPQASAWANSRETRAFPEYYDWASNPRHEHEWELWKTVRLPEGTSIIPGVITQSTVLVEHSDLVAQRIARFAEAVGRENVIAGADCGFASFATSFEIHPSIVWAKLASLVQGAKLASVALWGRASEGR